MNLKNNVIKKSLKPIKKRLQDKARVFIIIRSVYTHLSELTNEEILDYYSVNSLSELDKHLEKIKRILKEEAENHEEERQALDICFCSDSRGNFKYLYTDKKEAEKQIQFLLQTKSIKLSFYPCPFHCGWHLSKL